MTFIAVILTSLLLAQSVESAEPASQPASQPTTQPTLEELRAEHKAEIQKELVDIPKRGPISIPKLISLESHDGLIEVKPLIDPTDGQVAYDPTDWPGWVVITVGTPESAMMYFKHIDLSRPGEIGSYTNLITGIDYVQINRDSETEIGMTSTTLIQSKKLADESEEPIRLIVHKSSDEGTVPEFNLNITAADFDQLRRRHPKEVRQYLGSILKDLKAESLLQNNDADLAWQVLGPEIEPSGKLNAQLKLVIEKFNSDEFVTRAKAEDELAALGAPAASALSHWDLNSMPADPKASIESFIRSHQKATKDQVKSMRTDIDFILDLLLLDDPAIQSAAINRIGELTGKTIKLPANLSVEEKLVKIEEIRVSLAPTTQP